jgi:hypothetical protein
MSEQSMGKLSVNVKYFSFMTKKPETLHGNVANCTTVNEKYFIHFVSLLLPLKYRDRYVCRSLLH